MEQQLYKIRDRGKFGFMNRSGEVVIEPQYFEADEFYHGFSRVRMNDRLVLLDAMGRLYLKQLFNYIGYFEEELARVQLVQRWGYIDKKGNLPLRCSMKKPLIFPKGWRPFARTSSMGISVPMGNGPWLLNLTGPETSGADWRR